MALPDYYSLLGVQPSATPDELRAAFRRAILEHHPDRNDNKNSAQEWTILLKEAYDVLSDPQKRSRYDGARSGGAVNNNGGAAGSSSPPPSRPQTGDRPKKPSGSTQGNQTDPPPKSYANAPACQRCQAQDETLRFSSFTFVYSLLVFTRAQSRDAGFYCAPCRLRLSLKWAGICSLLGWWGFPFGLIWTLNALSSNLRGGTKSRIGDAEMLELIGGKLLSDGQTDAAAGALRQSMRLDPSRPTDTRLRELALSSPLPRSPRSLRHRLNRLPPFVYAAPFVMAIVISAVLLGADKPTSSSAPPSVARTAAQPLPQPALNPTAASPPVPSRPPGHDVSKMSDAQLYSEIVNSRDQVIAQGLDKTPQGKAALAVAEAVLKSPPLTNGDVLRRRGGVTSKCYLIVHNGNDHPAIVKLVGGTSTRYAIYVEAKRSATLWHVATGEYALKFSVGEGMNSRDLKFVGSHSNSRFPTPMDFTITPHGKGVMYSIEEITLHTVPDGNVHAEAVDDADFDEDDASVADGQARVARQLPQSVTGTEPVTIPTDVGQVWVNLGSGKYFLPGSKYYGKTKMGKYLSEADAKKQGYVAAQ